MRHIKRYSLAAGRTSGSPQLDSFGPDRILADELLKRGEKGTVLEYLDLCSKFWKQVGSDGPAREIDYWKEKIKSGEIPDLTAWVDL